MSEKTERAKELFKSGYNCSQSVFAVFAEELGVDFKTALKLSLPFGGGMGRMREVCGAVSGMFAAAGLAYASDDNSAENKKEMYKKVQELAQRFKDKNSSIVCRELLSGVNSETSPEPEKRTQEYYKKRPCVDLVCDAASILEEYMKENKPVNA